MANAPLLPQWNARLGDRADLIHCRAEGLGEIRYRASDNDPSDPNRSRYIGYAYSALRGEVENPVLDSNSGPSILSGIRYICYGLYAHHRNVQVTAGIAAQYFKLDSIAADLEIAASGHDISKPLYPRVFDSGKSYDAMDDDEKAIVNLHPYKSAEIVKMCAHSCAARIIVTAASLNRRHEQQYHDLQCIRLFKQGTDGHTAAQILEVSDQAIAMRETGPHRPYRRRPIPLDEIECRLPQQVDASREIIAYVMNLMRRSVSRDPPDECSNAYLHNFTQDPAAS